MITVKILGGDSTITARILNGCSHYGFEAKYNKKTAPYVHITLREDQAENLFWLGANIANQKIHSGLTESRF